MDTVILDSVDFRLDIDRILEKLHMDRESEGIEDLLRLIKIAEDLGRPKVLYKEAVIEDKGHDYIVADGVKLGSRLLRENLDTVDRIYPYICTCGRELYDWAKSLDDILEQYWMDKIMEAVLEGAIVAFQNHLKANYGLDSVSNMNPGSLEGWPINQQSELFAILGDPFGKIGVELTDSFLMLPIKSISGIRFSSEVDFVNCQLCPRERCENRRAQFDPHLYETWELEVGS
ncbi:MAG TPA: vitamin B12 dependent methionine synthase [Clostridia bacterium]|nr:vitamin B12 dependent methionine synthase [Clostridia bacterium]